MRELVPMDLQTVCSGEAMYWLEFGSEMKFYVAAVAPGVIAIA
jgi:hypothetical protein